MTPPTFYLAIPGAVAASVGTVMLYNKWTVSRVKAKLRRDIALAFIEEMATNHLPHIYHVLELLCHKLDIEVTEPPKLHYPVIKEEE